MTNSPAVFIFFAGGLIVYAAILYWSGKRRLWWLAILLSLPAVMGGVMRAFVDVPAEASAMARYFGLLVFFQLFVGVAAYRVGYSKSVNSVSSNGNSQV